MQPELGASPLTNMVVLVIPPGQSVVELALEGSEIPSCSPLVRRLGSATAIALIWAL